MLKIDVSGLKETQQMLAGFSDRRMRAATATALTRTAVEVRSAAQAELVRSIDRPTPYTQRQMRYIGATADNLNAAVGFDIEAITDIRGNVSRYSSAGKGNTPASKYLGPVVEGGGRHVKRFERALQAAGAMPQGWHAVPGVGAKLDAYGNISRGQIAQIVSQVGTELLRGYSNTLSKTDRTKRRRAFGRSGGQYVALPQGRGKLKPGIYLSEGRDFGARLGYGRSGRLVPVLIFVRSTTYAARFDFYGVTQRVAEVKLGANLARSVAEHIARLKRGVVA
jgi:hypothetical protein